MATRLITFLQINDIHGYLQPHPELFWQGNGAVYREAGGLARIAGFFKTVRQETDGKVMRYETAFLGAQGVPGKLGASRRDVGVDAVTALKNYLQREKKINPELRGNIVPI